MTLRVHPDEIVANSTSGMLATHSSWERVRLDQIASVLNGCAFPSAGFGKSGDMPLIRIRDVGRASTGTWYTGAFEPQYVVENGSLIVGMDGEFRVDTWRGLPALLNQRVCKIEVRNPAMYSERFLRWALPGYLDAVNRATSSVTVKHLSSRTINELPLPLPPIAEQKRIVAAIEEQLSRLGAGVAALERVQGQLKRMRRAVLQTAFAQHLADAPMVSLFEAASTQLGRMLSASRETGEHSKPYLRNRDVQWGHVRTQDLPVMDFAGADAERFQLNYGDVLICEGGEIGRAAVWTAPIAECYFQKAVHRVRCSTALDPYFLRYLLEHYAKTRVFDRFASGSTIAHLPQEDLRRLPVPIPSVAEQHATVSVIERQFSALDHLSDNVASLMDWASTLRASILAAAFSGELVPQKGCEEPASVLLERIAAHRASSNGDKPTQAPGRSRRKVKV